MSVILNSTISSETANSYVDQSYADAFWANDYRLSLAAQWNTLSAPQKQQLLVRACKIIETIRFTVPSRWNGDYHLVYNFRTQLVDNFPTSRQTVKYFYYQKLQFPRNLDIYISDPPTPSQIGTTYVPEDVMMAQCEQAIYMMNFDESIIQARLQGVQSDSVGIGNGDISTDQKYSGAFTMLAPQAIELLRPFMIKSSQMMRG